MDGHVRRRLLKRDLTYPGLWDKEYATRTYKIDSLLGFLGQSGPTSSSPFGPLAEFKITLEKGVRFMNAWLCIIRNRHSILALLQTIL